MEKQTMNVIREGIQYEVEKEPVYCYGYWAFKVKGYSSLFLEFSNCTPAPEKTETDLERARRLRDSVTNMVSTSSSNISLDIFDEMCDAYESTISRLTSGTWTDELVAEYTQYVIDESYKDTTKMVAFKPSLWLTVRRKEKEVKV